MGMTIDQIRERLDSIEIRAAAGYAAAQLHERGSASVVLCPNDGTRYDIIIVDRAGSYVSEGEHHPRDFMVATTVEGGACYQWRGVPIHPDYAAEKWGHDRTWTGVVFADFLTLVAEELDRLDATA
ncbi:MAG: hypothetical protein KDB37_17485 [Ilumatobacter sp.]|nr:hypothetical protein [Ilumatobacter sp.]